MIPEDIDKWFTDPNFGSDWQDVDLILAGVELLPRLKTYLADPNGTEAKKIWIISALLEIIEHECLPEKGPDSLRLAENIKNTIREHADLAERAMTDLGPIKEVVLRIILGLPIPSDYPQWVIDSAHEQGA